MQVTVNLQLTQRQVNMLQIMLFQYYKQGIYDYGEEEVELHNMLSAKLATAYAELEVD